MGKLGMIVAVTMLLPASVAMAQETKTPNLSVNGFGTVGLIYSDEDQADFASNAFVPDGAGYTRSWSPEVDSRLGLQLTADLLPRLTGIVQVVAEQRYDETYTPTIEWANLAFDITPDLNVRVGRMVLPVSIVSEYRKVGYANPWVRPPEEVYRLIPVTNFDGIDLSYRVRFGDFTNTLRAACGGKDINFADEYVLSEVKARDGVTVTDTLEWRGATLFASYTRFRLTVDGVNPLFDAFRRFGPEGHAIVDRYDIDNKDFDAVGVGVRYDPGGWFVMGEWLRSNSRTFMGDAQGWYVSGGYRFGAFTPYVTLARVRTLSSTSDPGLSTANLPPPLAAQAGGLNTVLSQLLGAAAQQKSLSAGVRWDFTRNAALKVQYEYLDLDTGSPGVLINTQPGFEPGGTVNLFSIAVDFVF